MRVLGVVNWKTTDKLGNPIAGVLPLVDVGKDGWRTINAQEEFPKQGQIFWPLAKDASERSLVLVNTKDNPGQKDEFRVDTTEAVTEILDTRPWGTLAAIRAALVRGIRRTDLAGKHVFLWYDSKKLLGPIKLVAGPAGHVVLDSGPKDRIRTFSISPDAVRTVNDGRADRHVPGRDLGAPSGFIDWDEDRMVLRRALATAVDLARERGSDPRLTKRLIEEAAEDVARAGTGPEVELNRYRLQRAAELCTEAAFVDRHSSEVSSLLLEHPSVKRSLDTLCEQRVVELGASLRKDAEKSIETVASELRELQAAFETTQSALARSREQLRQSEEALTTSRAHAIASQEETHRAFVSRLGELMKDPGSLLAEVSVLRPFLGSAQETRHQIAPTPSAEVAWARSANAIQDRVELQRALHTSFKAAGLIPASAVRIHAALVAGLVPVVIGSAGITALIAYARVVCGGRHAVLHISPAFSAPQDLFEINEARAGFSTSQGPRLTTTAVSTEGIQSFSVFICEGINRAPTESYLVPFLQLQRARAALGPSAIGGGGAGLPVGLRLAATAAAGSTCLPVTPDLWTYAVAVEVEDTAPTSTSPDVTEVLLSSELAMRAEVPRNTIEELIELVPVARACLSSLELFGAALGRFDSDAARVKRALIESILLPQIASQPPDARSGFMDSLKRVLPNDEESLVALQQLERRLRARLG